MPSITFKHEMNHYKETDSIFNQYKPLAVKYQVDFCMYSYKEIKKNLDIIEALVYTCKQDSLVYKMVTIPQVNLVRNTHYFMDQGFTGRFEKLRDQNYHFINLPLYQQLNKIQNYDYLSLNDHLKYHVPPTKPLSYEDLNSFIRQYNKVILKPVYGSKGRGITVIEKAQNGYKVYQTSTSTTSGANIKQKIIPYSQFKQFYDKTFRRAGSFLVQQWIQFQEYNGHPFDIRAVVQKNGKNKWQITSRVARVAGNNSLVTNLSQGGEMVSLSELQLKNYRAVRKFSRKVAMAFEKLYPWAAEMGIDLAIDQDGKIWYIETNFCPEKIRWSTIYKTPFEYAYYMYKKSSKIVRIDKDNDS